MSITHVRSDELTVVEEVDGLRRVRRDGDDQDWYFLADCKSRFRKPKLRSAGECLQVSINHGAAVGYRRYILIGAQTVMNYAREYAEEPAAHWRQVLGL